MISPISKYGSIEIGTVTAEDILRKSGIGEIDSEIFVLRFMLDWYYHDIGEYIGTKYRGKPYTEGAIRYRVRKIHDKIQDFLDKHQ